MVSAVLKRAMDVTVALGGLALLALPALLIALAVRRTMGSGVVFRQVRPGRNRRPFAVYKFRTMSDARDESGKLLPDGHRLTHLGRFLRRTSLDEIPQLWNVLKGDMSLVGPRPLLMRYLPYYTDRESIRFAVRPGITGWAQVNGRNHLGWDRRLALDAWYVENRSLGLDCRILLMTLIPVLTRKGLTVDTRSTGGLDLDEERAGQGRRQANAQRATC